MTTLKLVQNLQNIIPDIVGATHLPRRDLMVFTKSVDAKEKLQSEPTLLYNIA